MKVEILVQSDAIGKVLSVTVASAMTSEVPRYQKLEQWLYCPLHLSAQAAARFKLARSEQLLKRYKEKRNQQRSTVMCPVDGRHLV